MRETERKPYECVVFVCCNTRADGKPACGDRGGDIIRERLKQYVKEKNLKLRIRVAKAMCLDLCSTGPIVCMMPDNVWYQGVQLGDVPALIEKHIRPLEGTA